MPNKNEKFASGGGAPSSSANNSGRQGQRPFIPRNQRSGGDFQNRGGANNAQGGNPNFNKPKFDQSKDELYVSGFADKTNKEDLIQAFSKFGDVKNVRINVSRTNNNQYAHVQLSTPEEAQKACANPPSIRGLACIVKPKNNYRPGQNKFDGAPRPRKTGGNNFRSPRKNSPHSAPNSGDNSSSIANQELSGGHSAAAKNSNNIDDQNVW